MLPAGTLGIIDSSDGEGKQHVALVGSNDSRSPRCVHDVAESMQEEEKERTKRERERERMISKHKEELKKSKAVFTREKEAVEKRTEERMRTTLERLVVEAEERGREETRKKWRER